MKGGQKPGDGGEYVLPCRRSCRHSLAAVTGLYCALCHVLCVVHCSALCTAPCTALQCTVPCCTAPCHRGGSEPQVTESHTVITATAAESDLGQ